MAEKDFTGGPIDPASKPAVKPPRKKRWLMLKIFGIAVVAIILLVLVAPTLLSTRPVLAVILGRVNARLNGRVEVSSLSLGWFSGVNLRGVRVFDNSQAQIAQLDQLVVPMPLWKPLVGKFELGDVLCDGLTCDAKYDAEHRLNFEQLIKQAPPPPAPATSAAPPSPAAPAPPASSSPPIAESKASKLPAISGTIKLTNCSASVSQPGKPTMFVSKVNGQVKIPDINQTITDALSMNIRSGDGHEGSMNLSGTADAVKQNVVALNSAEIHQTFDLTELDLRALQPFLSSAASTSIEGLVGVHVAVDFSAGKDAKVDATVTGKKAVAGAAGASNGTVIDQLHLALSSEYHGNTAGGAGGGIPDLRNIKLSVSSKPINGEFGGTTLADLNGTLTADLTQAVSEIQQFVPGAKLKAGGNVTMKVTATGRVDQPPYQSALSVNITGQDLQYAPQTGSQISEPLVQLNFSTKLHGTAAKAIESVQDLSLTLKTGDVNSPSIDLLAEAPNVALGDAMAADFHLTHLTADLARLQKEFAAVPPKTEGIVVNHGTLSISGQGAFKNHALAIDGLKIAAEHLSLVRQTADGKQANPMADGALHLDGSANADLNPTADQKSTVKLTGTLAELAPLLGAYEGKKTDAYPYRGEFTLSEIITLSKTGTTLQGGLQVAKFQSLNGATVTFSEDLLAISNDIVMTTLGNDKTLGINNLLIAMQSSGALNVAIKNGSVHHLQSSRDLQLQPTMDYDLAKLWPIVQPIMGDKCKTLKITGQFKKQFNVTGSYPADQPSTVAIKTVHADGDLSVATFDYDGLNLQNFVVPFTLDNGKLVTVYVNKPAGQNTAAPAVANGGTLDLGDLTSDLTQSPMRLTVPANKHLISKLTVNPLFANSFLAKYLNNPVFTGNNASGLFDLTMVDCDALPMGDLVTKTDAANTGKADLKFSLTDLHIGFQGISGLASIVKEDSFAANVKDGTVSVAKGLSTEHISFVSGDYSLNFDGTVRLADEAMIPLNLSIGPIPAIVGKAGVHDQNILKYLPDRVSVPVKGTVEHASVGLDLQKLLADAGANAITNGLLGGDKNNNGDSGNPLGGLLNRLQKKKK